MKDPQRFWDGFAERYARQPIRDPDAYARTLERTRSYLRPTDHMLELGCGTGTTALKLADAVEMVTASDISPAMIRIAEEKAASQGVTNVRFVCADVFDPSLGEGPYDAVAAFNLLHLLADPEAAVRRVHGLLKPGGVFISKTPGEPGPGSPIFFRVMRAALPVLQAIGIAPYVNFVSRDELSALFTGAGFEILETGEYPVAPPNRFVAARKL